MPQTTAPPAVNLPNLLSASRVVAAPLLVLLALAGRRDPFLVTLGLALATDAIDGPLARHMRIASETGARLDSWGDLAIYTSAPFALLWLWPDAFRPERLWTALVIAGYLVPVSLGLLKYRRLTSYHTRAAKLAAVVLSLSLLPLLLGGIAVPFRLAALLVAYSALEEIAITCTLAHWTPLVPTLARAILIRRSRRMTVDQG